MRRARSAVFLSTVLPPPSLPHTKGCAEAPTTARSAAQQQLQQRRQLQKHSTTSAVAQHRGSGRRERATGGAETAGKLFAPNVSPCDQIELWLWCWILAPAIFARGRLFCSPWASNPAGPPENSVTTRDAEEEGSPPATQSGEQSGGSGVAPSNMAAAPAPPTTDQVNDPDPSPNSLPDVTVQDAFTFLNGPAEVLTASLACRRWRVLATTDVVWRGKFEREGMRAKAGRPGGPLGWWGGGVRGWSD